MTALLHLARALQADPALATPRQRIAGCLLLTAGLVLAAFAGPR